METAVNVKYLLQILLRAFYPKTDSPTLTMLYNAVFGLYKGKLDLDVDDEEWQRQLRHSRVCRIRLLSVRCLGLKQTLTTSYCSS